MELHDRVPTYDVQLANHLTIGITKWTKMQRSGFLKEVAALGSSALTRTIRHVGGKATWVSHGDYHMTYTADPETRIITVVAARPCSHGKRCARTTV